MGSWQLVTSLAAKAQLNTCTCLSVCMWSKLNFFLFDPLSLLCCAHDSLKWGWQLAHESWCYISSSKSVCPCILIVSINNPRAAPKASSQGLFFLNKNVHWLGQLESIQNDKPQQPKLATLTHFEAGSNEIWPDITSPHPYVNVQSSDPLRSSKKNGPPVVKQARAAKRGHFGLFWGLYRV